MYEDPGSHFLKTNTGIESGADTVDESRLAMTFLTNLGITRMLCFIRLYLKEKAGKEIPESSRLEFLERFSANNLVLFDT